MHSKGLMQVTAGTGMGQLWDWTLSQSTMILEVEGWLLRRLEQPVCLNYVLAFDVSDVCAY